MNEFDVLVVGAGPAGSAAATWCARQGLAVALIERKHFPRHKVCGDVINPGCWPILARLGVAGRVRQLPLQAVNGVVIAPARGRELCLSAQLTALRRSVLDACLLQQAREAGVEVVEGEAVQAVQPGWTVSTVRRSYRARVLLGADGRQSTVARLTGLSARRPVGRRWQRVVAFQGHYPAPATLDGRVYLHLFPGGYSGLVRIDAGLVNLCIVTAAGPATHARDPAALFAQSVWRNGHFRSLGIVPEPVAPLQGAYPMRRAANRPAGAKVYLVGDALRVVEPFTGQGILFALGTAELAAAAVGGSGVDYARASDGLYRCRARTNRWVRGLLYRERVAAGLLGLVRGCPAVLNWLAANVLHE